MKNNRYKEEILQTVKVDPRTVIATKSSDYSWAWLDVTFFEVFPESKLRTDYPNFGEDVISDMLYGYARGLGFFDHEIDSVTTDCWFFVVVKGERET